MPNLINSTWSAIASNYHSFLLLAILIVTLSFFKSPTFKGFIGERLVRLAAWRKLDSSIYFGVHNITLYTDEGTTQIDHIFVSKFGIFVVETKNYKGWIFGSEHQENWTQKLYKKSYKFQNPLRQNYKHLRALEAALAIPFNVLKPVIVFVGDSRFKTDMPESVTNIATYTRYIRSFTRPVLDDGEVIRLLGVIQTKRLKPSFKTNRAHVQSLQARLNAKKTPQRVEPKL